MAAVASNTVVRIPANVRVLEIGCNVVPMATDALERRIGRGGTGMAICANAGGVAVPYVKESMGHRRSQPIGSQGCVARRAVGCDDSDGGSIRGQVIRDRPAEIRGALPCNGVATVAIDRRHSGS